MRRPTVSSPSAAVDPVAALRDAVPASADAAFRAGSLALRASEEEAALPWLRAATERYRSDARLWQLLGLAARNLGELAEGIAALTRARDLAPTDALIAHGAARARLDGGVRAVEDFDRARRLAPSDGSLLQGLAAARFATGDVAGAIDEIDRAVRASPMWLDGHATLARLRRMAGDGDELRSYREACHRFPRQAELWLGWLSTLSTAERYAEFAPVIAAARRAMGDRADIALFQAIGEDETGQHDVAGRYFDQLPAVMDPSTRVWRVRSLLRRGRIEEAAQEAHTAAQAPDGRSLWPYVALAWRLLDDPRWSWLEGDPTFVQIHDLHEIAPEIDCLADHLRSLHVARGQPLDQSVRGGTQTDGPLLFRIEPEVRRLRQAIDKAVGKYIDALPPNDPTHPLLGAGRDRRRYAGSWSVRLAGGGGHHADHVHSHGWISSALYIALPEEVGGQDRHGWLTFGASAKLLPDLTPFREVEPVPGRLVLFPSTMWHGTRPFEQGERLTVAFDVARLDR